jgi:hypothetical protein
MRRIQSSLVVIISVIVRENPSYRASYQVCSDVVKWPIACAAKVRRTIVLVKSNQSTDVSHETMVLPDNDELTSQSLRLTATDSRR